MVKTSKALMRGGKVESGVASNEKVVLEDAEKLLKKTSPATPNGGTSSSEEASPLMWSLKDLLSKEDNWVTSEKYMFM